jgi:ATP-dependent RNA helicase DeaD
VMRAFKNENIQMLVCTDVAARGIDVAGLSYVIHFDLPEQMDYYTHRSGRTARAGKKGLSVGIVIDKDLKRLNTIERALDIKFREYSV